MPMPTTTARLIVRRFEESDVDFLHAMYNIPEVMKFLGTGGPFEPRSREWAAERLEKRIAAYDQKTYPMFWAVDEIGGEQIGAVLLNKLPDTEHIEVGYHFIPSAWGKGFATESALEAVRYGFCDLQLPEIIGVHNAENPQSGKVLEKIGLEYGGVRFFYGHDLEYYSLTREKWLDKRL